jgi:VWFA-related protein
MLRALMAVLVMGVAGGSCAAGQAAGSPNVSGQESPQQTPYTLQVYSRAVLTDVTVTDKQGNPVTGLTEQDFRIFDNGKPQQMATVEPASTTPRSFNNAFLRHPPPQVNVLLFDDTTIGIVEQMFLFQEMKRFVEALPAGEPVAVFTRWGDTVQLSGFTDDHATVLAAMERAIPRLQETGAWMTNDMDPLHQMGVYLSQVPGRKNLIWFTTGSNLFLGMGPGDSPFVDDPEWAEERQEVYDMMESERIAIYPIDAGGLRVYRANVSQQMQMLQDAEATGGHAYVNTNGLALAAQHILSTDGNYYTLTYSPQDLKNKGDWHRVQVKLDRKGYELSYRRGYYDDGSNLPTPQQGKTRTVLKAGGKKYEVPTEHGDPIVFTAQVDPVLQGAPHAVGDHPLRRGMHRYRVLYLVLGRDVGEANVQGTVAKSVVGSAVLAFDHNGEPVAKQLRQVTVSVDEAKEHRLPDANIAFAETVDLPKGWNCLYLAVWDPATGRMGTVNAQVDVEKASR